MGNPVQKPERQEEYVPIGDLGKAISEAEDGDRRIEEGFGGGEFSESRLGDMWSSVFSEIAREVGSVKNSILESELSKKDKGGLSDSLNDAKRRASNELKILAENSGIPLEDLKITISQKDRLREMREFSSSQVETINFGEDGALDSFKFFGESYSKQENVGSGAGKDVFLIKNENQEEKSGNVKLLAEVEGRPAIDFAIDEVVTLLELQISDVENVVDIDGFFALDSEGDKVDINLGRLIKEDGGNVEYDTDILSDYIEKNDIERFYIVEEYLEGADLNRIIPDFNEGHLADSIEKKSEDEIKQEILGMVSNSIESERAEEVADMYISFKLKILKDEYSGVSDRDIYAKILRQEKFLEEVCKKIKKISRFEEIFSVINDNVRGIKEGHKLGIVHGDVKFANMAYEEKGRVKKGKVIDYGASKARIRYGGRPALASNGTPCNLGQRGYAFDEININRKNVQDTDAKGVVVESLDNFVSGLFSMDKITRNGLGSEFRHPNNAKEFAQLFSSQTEARQELGVALMTELGLDEEVISTLVKFETAEESAEAIPDIDVVWKKFEKWWKGEFSQNLSLIRAMGLVMSYLSSEEAMDDLIMQGEDGPFLTLDGAELFDLIRDILGKDSVDIGGDYCSGATEDLYHSLTQDNKEKNGNR